MLLAISVLPLAILQPLRVCPAQRAASVMMSAVETDAESDTADDSDDWSAVDAWLAESSQGAAAAMEEGSLNHRWESTSKGHMHEHFVERNAKMREWAALGASERLETNLQRLGFSVPSTTQAAAFAHVLGGENLLLADANGMGKTLAYVAPIVQKLWEWEERDGKTPPGEVRTIIIVPTNDLAQQVLELAREVGYRSLRASVATGEHSWKTQRTRMKGGLDLLVGTMGRLVGHVSPRGMEPSFSIDGLRLLVVDEASSLYQGKAPSYMSKNAASRQGAAADAFDETSYDVQEFRRQPLLQEPPLAMWKFLRGELPQECSTVMVSSALPDGVSEQIREDVPAIVEFVGKGIHTTRAGVPLELVDVETSQAGRESIFEAKLRELRDCLAGSRHSLVLCNNPESCARIERALRDEPFACGDRACPIPGLTPTLLCFHGSLTAERRENSLKSFRRATLNQWEKTAMKSAAEGELPPARCLIATGSSVRGLDFTAGEERQLDHVVLWDFPPNAKAYLARVGCATRGTRPAARVTALALRSQLAFAKAMLANDEAGSAHELY